MGAFEPRGAENQSTTRDRAPAMRGGAAVERLKREPPVRQARANERDVKKNGAEAPFSKSQCPATYFLAASALEAWTVPSFIVTPLSVTSWAIIPSIGFWQSASKL